MKPSLNTSNNVLSYRSLSSMVSDRPSKTAQDSDGEMIRAAHQAEELRAPRYTSYPTADQFVEAFGPQDYARSLESRTLSGSGPLSVYVHVPFCQSLCHFCGCNKVVTQYPAKSKPYVWRLIDEISLIDKHLV